MEGSALPTTESSPDVFPSTGAIDHAAASHLAPIDAIQYDFLHRLGISPNHAFLQHNLAPQELRRDIAALGLLHKSYPGRAPFGIPFSLPAYSGYSPWWP